VCLFFIQVADFYQPAAEQQDVWEDISDIFCLIASRNQFLYKLCILLQAVK